MSGGSYGYAYSRVANFADDLVLSTNLRKAFHLHLYAIADAMHDIEWVDSGDYGPGTEDSNILKCISEDSVLESTITTIYDLRSTLEQLINKLETEERMKGDDE